MPAPTISNADAGMYTPFAVNGDRDPFGALHMLDVGGRAPVAPALRRCGAARR